VQTTIETPRTGLSTSALVLGIVSACIGLIPILGILALPCAVLAIIFGIIGMRRNVRRGFAITGLATGCLGIVLAIAGLVIVNNAVNEVNDCFDAISEDIDNNTNTADEAC
jgi:uncharacterized membrane protein